MSLWGKVLPQMDDTFLLQSKSLCSPVYDFYVIGKKHKSEIIIDPHNLDVICVISGCLLGDAHAEFRSGTIRICFQQENKNTSYLYMLHNFFAKRRYCNPEKPKLQRRLGKNGKVRFMLRFKTWSFKSFNWIHEAFYQNKIKQIPNTSFLNSFLNEQSLAVWIIDDGTKSGNGLSIATNSFKYEHLLQMTLFLKEKYNLKVSVSKCGVDNAYVLYFSTKSMSNLANLVKPYFNENIKYKLEKYGSLFL